ncbi:MAG TPA: hypothetical protein EYP29_01330 [Thermoplasmata archaeon]|nr:hypothetical protein [Thermoplasmata archaeon]
MNIAENLYNNGYISYPRTDNTVYPASLNLREIVSKFLSSKEFSSIATEIYKKKRLKPTRGKRETTDHPPIYPVHYVEKSKLSAQEWRLYEMIVRRFFATLGEAAVLEKVTVDVEIEKEPFVARGQRYLELGWRAYYPYGMKKDNVLPDFINGDKKEEVVDIKKMEFLEKETQPPPRYSLAKLIQLMEELGLGTKSTRHTIISKLYERGYIKGNPPVPTEIGYSVLDALENHAQIITKPDMTATLEKEMLEISKGEKTLQEIVQESQGYLEKVVDILESHRKEIGKEIREAIDKKNEIGKCPKCGSPLILRKSRFGKRFVGCKNYPKCDQTYPLPPYGKIVATDEVCSVCGAPFVNVYSKKKKKPWKICINFNCPSKKERKESQEDEIEAS